MRWYRVGSATEVHVMWHPEQIISELSTQAMSRAGLLLIDDRGSSHSWQERGGRACPSRESSTHFSVSSSLPLSCEMTPGSKDLCTHNTQDTQE